MDEITLYVAGGLSVAVNALAGFVLWLLRKLLRSKDDMINDLRKERDTYRQELEECHDKHHG